ncbi:hypothetical protein EOT10_39495 [Streptomyces antnestii]|uniref:Uncharacterized protein n=1 Tax=Streptomyces antnestii TaxID=2494256 RepID=A0A3S2XHW4_9ACTN|nr:hypothetical protein [Streptomyces sp. San01]RVU15254.1 hypothetical protein EOT10_39495 [Streptomyces sp. San01]
MAWIASPSGVPPGGSRTSAFQGRQPPRGSAQGPLGGGQVLDRFRDPVLGVFRRTSKSDLEVLDELVELTHGRGDG